MNRLIIEIRGNKYNEREIDEMLNDYINIGENIYKRRTKVVETLLKAFIKKYRKKGFKIISKKRNLKQFLNSAKLIYQLAEFYLCNNLNYDKYVYMLTRNLKGAKVYLYLNYEKKLALIYNSIPNFLESWFIYRKLGGVIFGKEIESNL